MTDLLKRSITGAVFVLVMITMICVSIYSLAALLLFILITASIEYANLMGLNSRLFMFITLILPASLIFIITFCVRLELLDKSFIIWSLLFGISFPPVIISRKSENNFYNSVFKIFGAYIYLVLPLSLSLYLVNYSSYSYESGLLISVLALIWVYDTFAYLTGSILGKHKIIPSISPKKSWEGVIGGYLFMIPFAYFLSKKLLNGYPFYIIIIMCLIIVVAGTTGDFFESYLKRRAGVKDSGNLLPGHGGILDRFDSFLFIITPIFIFLKLI